MDSFEFSPKAEFTSPLYVHIAFATDTEAPSLCLAQLIHVNLVICFDEIIYFYN